MELEGDVVIAGDDITNLNALNIVTSIGGCLIIRHNDALASLTGLENIDAASIYFLFIYYNAALSTCEVQCVCDYLANPNGFIEIHDKTTGCDNPEEVQEAFLTIVVKERDEIGMFTISPNPFSQYMLIKFYL